MANTSIYAAFERMWQHIVAKLRDKADVSHNHNDYYDSKGASDEALASAKIYADTTSNEALTSAKAYADVAADTVKNDLLNGAGAAYDTLKELGDLIDENIDAIEALEIIATGKADSVHTHDDLYYTEAEIDSMEFITAEDLYTICGANIQHASMNEVTF